MTLLTAGELEMMRGDLEGTELGMTCVVERATPGAADAWGQPSAAWATLHAALPCYWWTDRELEVVGPNMQAVVSRQHLIVPAGTDVTTQDRIASVTGMDGSQVAGPLRITAVRPRLVDMVLDVDELGASS